ncbi:type III pantothenate kinase [Echinicola jeungdonensis]|uniref:Type III pantothenate kinase n=1 Tax=Echinicola jeungdonensis TaxID=709343 RepID=A0ABV5J1Y7_9BACT|nr:type III pantothenate kinase [Echinicola jeungdonensis]MDN3668985.1 type III pantothenate kinase [Echinicola jeungdonensis]
MRNLIIDIGNTRTKTALFSGQEVLWEEDFGNLGQVASFVQKEKFDNAIMSSVKWDKGELKDVFQFDFLFLDFQTSLPIKNNYQSPQTLGLDRVAAAVGAWALAGKGPVLGIDLGTCITYEFVDPKDNYLGGGISPGLQMRLLAMHQQTAKLPLASISTEELSPELIGGDTLSCLKSGVYHGTKQELEGIIKEYQSSYKDLRVYICGGDAKFFESLTKDYIFVIPNLVLYGLNRILIYNVDKN